MEHQRYRRSKNSVGYLNEEFFMASGQKRKEWIALNCDCVCNKPEREIDTQKDHSPGTSLLSTCIIPFILMILYQVKSWLASRPSPYITCVGVFMLTNFSV